MNKEKKEKLLTEALYTSIEGIKYADPMTREISDDFDDSQKHVLKEALISGLPARAVASPDIPADIMKTALVAWGDIYYYKLVPEPPVKVNEFTLWEAALVMSDKDSMLYKSHHSSDRYLSGTYAGYAEDAEPFTVDEDIEMTILCLLLASTEGTLVNVSAGVDLMQILPIRHMMKDAVVMLSCALLAGKDYTKEYIKTGKVPTEKIQKTCYSKNLRIPHVRCCRDYNAGVTMSRGNAPLGEMF